MMTPFHDPLILPVEDGFLGYSTDLACAGVQTRPSPDLLHWSEPFPLLTETPPSVTRHAGTDHFWAPEVVRRGDTWRLYTCASRFGTTQSVISLFQSDTPRGPFQYQGDVVISNASETVTQPNAIDPCVIADREGNDWLIYGSFFGGIRILPLTPAGFPAIPGVGKLIAGGHHQAIEGGYAYYHKESDRFILFTSWGSLSRDYHVRIGYSDRVDGPYLDSQGLDLTDHDPIHVPGDKLLGGCHFDLPGVPGMMAPGHNSLLLTGGQLYIVHHQRPEGDVAHPHLALRPLFFQEKGKLLAWPLPYDGEALSPLEKAPEKWSVVYLQRDNAGVVYGRKCTSAQCAFTLEGTHATMALYGKAWTGFAYRQGAYAACTLGSEDGECLWCVEDAT